MYNIFSAMQQAREPEFDYEKGSPNALWRSKEKPGTVSKPYDNIFAGEDGRYRHSEVLADLVALEVEVFLKEDRIS